MRALQERGSAVIEAVVVGSISVLVLVPVLAAATALQSAREEVDQASQVAAAEAVRTGELAKAAEYVAKVIPDAEIQVQSDDTGVTVTVGRSVGIVGPGGLVSRWVEATARADHSPYRSRLP